MRCTTVYSNSRLQVVLVYLHPFRCNYSLLKPKIAQKSLNPYFGGSRSFKVITVEPLKAYQ